MKSLLLALALLAAVGSSALPAQAQVSKDGSIIAFGLGKLVTPAGTWTLSLLKKGADGNVILLNGQPVAGGSAWELLVDDGGQLYAHGLSGTFWVWSGSAFVVTDRFAPLRAQCATAVVVGLEWQPTLLAAKYNVLRNGTPLKTTGLFSYSDQTVQPLTTYSYEVDAIGLLGRTISTRTIEVTTAAANPLGDPAVCPSTFFSGMNWNWSTGANQQNGSDLWPSTWGADGNIYTFFGDGGGFFGGDQLGRSSFGVAEITAPAPAPNTVPVFTQDAFFNIYGGLNATHPSTLNGKADDILAVGNDFYALGGTYQAGIDTGGPSGAPDHYEILYSKGNAYTWQSNYPNWYFCDDFSDPAGICPIAFVQSGKGNVSSFDNYVYLLGASQMNFLGDGGLCSCTYLARVPKDQMLTKSAYEVYTGTGLYGVPTWSANWSSMQPIFQDNGPRPMHLKKMVYNSQLKRFISLAQGSKVNEDSWFDSPTPWGPFTVIASYPSQLDHTGGWGNIGSTTFSTSAGGTLGVNFINKWTSADGLTMWAAFSSNKNAGPNTELLPLANQSMDSYSIVSTTLSLAPQHAIPYN
jgi:hypothetical protein